MSSDSSAQKSNTTTIRLPKFDPKDIKSIVGPSLEACRKNEHLHKRPSLRKNVISATWRSYNLYKEKEDITEEDPKTPYVQVKTDDDGVYATVSSDSEVMTKFTLHHLNKYQDSFVPPKKKFMCTLYAVLPHECIPQLIGRGGSSVNSIRSEAICQMDEENDPNDISECEKTYTKVDKFTPRDFDDFVKMVGESDRHKFIGWDPKEGDELVKVFVSSHVSSLDVFEEFVECLHDSFQTRINEIGESSKRFASSKEDELKEVMSALNAEW